MKLCTECGHQMGDNAHACPKCGEPSPYKKSIVKNVGSIAKKTIRILLYVFGSIFLLFIVMAITNVFVDDYSELSYYENNPILDEFQFKLNELKDLAEPRNMQMLTKEDLNSIVVSLDIQDNSFSQNQELNISFHNKENLLIAFGANQGENFHILFINTLYLMSNSDDENTLIEGFIYGFNLPNHKEYKYRPSFN